MILRPRQREFVTRCVSALKSHGNTLGVAPTGAGKTICLSGTAGEFLAHPDAKACVLAHRDELIIQNHSKFARVNPGISTSVFDAREKSWAGQATFAMVQTLARNLEQIPALDLLVVDEAHHCAAPTYRQVIDTVLARNPSALIYGVTATPNRGDGKGLREVFSNVADQIRLGELIRSGHLVAPRTFVVDVGTREALDGVKKLAEDYDMTAVASIMNTSPVNEAVVSHWKERAAGRKTIVFAATVAHAQSVCEAFLAAGVHAATVYGEMSVTSRHATLAAFESGDIVVIVNVAVLTEGYDYTPTSCIVLLRPSSYKSTLIQMVGRGLRVVDPAEYPGVIKTDCIVLDFGTASLKHGSLEQEVDLDGFTGDGEAPTKVCPDCEAEVPRACRDCPLCGHVFETASGGDAIQIADFVMTEIDLLKRSNFAWCDLFGDDCALLATGFKAWAGVFFLNGRWCAVGGAENSTTHLLGVGERTVCLAQANDWLNDQESDDAAHKTRRWLNESPTQGQLRYLPPAIRADFGLTRYQASALLTFQFNKHAIKRLVQAANDAQMAPAREAA
jgi:superfamily II DNA or RNA helicase